MKDTDLLFISMELNIPENAGNVKNREIIKISTAAVLRDGEEKRSTWHVKPQSIDSVSKNTLKITKISRKSLVCAKYIDDVLRLLWDKYGSAQTLVIWSKYHYDFLCPAAEKCGIRLPQNVVILCDLIETITQNHIRISNIRTALNEKGIEYEENQLHNTVVSVEYLYSLYRKLYSEYKTACAKSVEVCCKSVKTNVIHNKNCVYVRKILPDNYAAASRLEIFKGANVCKSCTRKYFGKIDWHRKEAGTVKFKPSFDDVYADELCRHFGLECSTGEGVIFIRSRATRWRIYHNGKKVIDIFHENHRPNAGDYKNKKRKINTGFHRQNVNIKTLYGAVKYIYYHDADYINRFMKKSRMEILFEQMEKQQQTLKAEENANT